MRGKYSRTCPVTTTEREHSAHMLDLQSMAKFFFASKLSTIDVPTQLYIFYALFMQTCVLERTIHQVDFYLHFNPSFCPTPN